VYHWRIYGRSDIPAIQTSREKLAELLIIVHTQPPSPSPPDSTGSHRPGPLKAPIGFAFDGLSGGARTEAQSAHFCNSSAGG